MYPTEVTIIEVGPRDGLQREKCLIPTSEKIALIEALVASGIRRIQVTSFVHPQLVPQMADAEEVCARLDRREEVIYSGLALNVKGVNRAHEAGLDHIDISVSASDAHSRRNTNRSLEEAMVEFRAMVQRGRHNGMVINGGIQCAFGYLQSSDVPAGTVLDIARQHLALGVDELVLADSSGLANPLQVTRMLEQVLPLAGKTPVVMHLHDTRGMGLANVLAALQCGIRAFDTAFGGLGGCPFIDGAAGNIPTEDTVHMLHEMGIKTGIDLPQVGSISRQFERRLGKVTLPGKLYHLVTVEEK
jgi:hydroxymethylglutaryl-CoA lyase